MNNITGLKRDEEHLYNSLKAKRERASLSEDNELMLSLLEDKYNRFLEEGLKKLRSANNMKPPPVHTAAVAGGVGVGVGGSTSQRSGDSQDSFCSASPADSPSNGPPLTSSPLTPRERGRRKTVKDRISTFLKNKVTSPNKECIEVPEAYEGTHWTWISNNIVAGAPPHASHSNDGLPNLRFLQEQLVSKQMRMGMVVSLLGLDEFGAALGECAQPRDWETALHVDTFMNLPMPEDPDATLDIGFDEVLHVCNQMYQIVQTPPADQVVFVHCKAGKGRTWVLLMCYFISQRQLTYTEAQQMLAERRPKMTPSATQANFARDFENYVNEKLEDQRQNRSTTQAAAGATLGASPLTTRVRADDEAKYLSILAELLTLPPEYRVRLLFDLEKLT